MIKISRCPSTLKDGFAEYSPSAKQSLFDGKDVSCVLPYLPPSSSEKAKTQFLENREVLSISGAQEKFGIIQKKNKLFLSVQGEQSTHILKPQVRDLPNGDQTCANEHLTMQIASQIFGIKTAANAICFFQNGTPAYITRRFDVTKNGKLKMEDFASIIGKTPNDGHNFKYNSSYEDIAISMRKYIPAWRIEIVKFFKLVLFNYIVANGDAHLKNFAILETPFGDSILSPAYDLMNTALHINDAPFALSSGLFKDEPMTEISRETFRRFAIKIGLSEQSTDKILSDYISGKTLNGIEALTAKSFLRPTMQKRYLSIVRKRMEILKL